MLKCVSRYRSAGLGVFVEPGEVLTGIDAEMEAQLLRDSPLSFEQVEGEVLADDLVAPQPKEQKRRERATREESEREPIDAMSAADHPGLVPPK